MACPAGQVELRPNKTASDYPASYKNLGTVNKGLVRRRRTQLPPKVQCARVGACAQRRAPAVTATLLWPLADRLLFLGAAHACRER